MIKDIVGMSLKDLLIASGEDLDSYFMEAKNQDFIDFELSGMDKEAYEGKIFVSSSNIKGTEVKFYYLFDIDHPVSIYDLPWDDTDSIFMVVMKTVVGDYLKEEYVNYIKVL